MGRLQGRITKEDIREAGFRRWDGQNRITTDWVNVFFEPELYWPDGDTFVYLREPGASSRGPAFKVHTVRLREKGFHSLLKRCVPQTKLHLSTQCLISNCPGCRDHGLSYELYIPAPPRSGLESTLDHHTTTRNFFAWLYALPLAGRALGKSLVDLKARIDLYRPAEDERNSVGVLSFTEKQKYLDFRECVDHALAALRLAEVLQVEDLWIDAFAHCVGMDRCGLRDSVEYPHVSAESKILINQARLGLDVKLQKVSKTVANFFEDELSSAFLGLPQVARDHLDRFRSFLHAYYIEQHGFWPPNKFEDEAVQRLVCNGMYVDFRNLYMHLVDPTSSASNMDADLSTTGGVCVLQNVKSFDTRHHLTPLPQPLPKMPSVATVNIGTLERRQRRNSWNPIARHREDKERRNAQHMQALIDSTNRDWTLMNNVLVRRYSEFEIEAAVDELDTISLADGRKVRWIVVYAIYHILISITQAPKQVRNAEGLSYSLCCEAPALMPWEGDRGRKSSQVKACDDTTLEPDTLHSHTNTAPPSPGGITRTLSKTSIASTPGAVKRSTSSVSTIKERRQTIHGDFPERSASSKSLKRRSSSLRRLMSVKKTGVDEAVPAVPALPNLKIPNKRAAFCEIYVPGYGNGLNHVKLQTEVSMTELPMIDGDTTPSVPQLPGNPSVSRESSNASNNSTWSKTTSMNGTEASTPDASPLPGSESTSELDLLCEKAQATIETRVIDLRDDGLDTVHFNTRTWDDMLNVLDKRKFGLTR